MNNEVLHILSHDGSLEFKQQIANAENMARPNSSSTVDQLYAMIAILNSQLRLLHRELINSAYSEHQRGVIETYRDKVSEVIGLLQTRVNELYQEEQNNQTQESYDSDDSDAENVAYARSLGMSIRRRGGRKSRRRSIRKSRRKSIRKSRRRSIRRRKY